MGNVFGILLCLVIAAPAWYFGRMFPLIGGPVIAILSGIAVSVIAPKFIKAKLPSGYSFATGLKFTSKKVLQYSIVFLGFEMNLYHVLRAGRASLVIMLFTFAAVLLTAFALGKALKLSGNTTTLIGVGTAICGGSAIAAVAPIIRAEDEDVTRAISTVFLFNTIAVFIFPPLGRMMGMSNTTFGMWAGTAITDTSSVVAAGSAWSVASGSNDALNYATIVKLTRTLMIVPIALILALYTARKAKSEASDSFQFAKIFPWFVLLFIAAACISTFVNIPPTFSSSMVRLGKFGIVMAMAAIGLNTNLKSLFANGVRPIVLGSACWAMIAGVTLIVLRF